MDIPDPGSDTVRSQRPPRVLRCSCTHSPEADACVEVFLCCLVSTITHRVSIPPSCPHGCHHQIADHPDQALTVGESLARLQAEEKNSKNPLHIRLLALEIFTLVYGPRFDHWVSTSPEDEARLVGTLGNAFRTPNHTPKTAIPSSHGQRRARGRLPRVLEGRTESLFILCPPHQASLRRPVLYIVTTIHVEVCPWLRAASPSSTDIENNPSGNRASHPLEKIYNRHRAAPPVIRCIWLTRDSWRLLHFWGDAEREPLELIKVSMGPGRSPFDEYLRITELMTPIVGYHPKPRPVVAELRLLSLPGRLSFSLTAVFP